MREQFGGNYRFISGSGFVIPTDVLYIKVILAITTGKGTNLKLYLDLSAIAHE